MNLRRFFPWLPDLSVIDPMPADTISGPADIPPRFTDDYRSFVGPADQFDLMGASQFNLLTTLGLRDDHRVLDFGCGSLRLGRLLIPYLKPRGYAGLEPNRWLIDAAISHEIGEDIIRIKQPSFYHNDDFQIDPAAGRFDFIMAQSIFSHVGVDLIEAALPPIATALADDGMLLMTVLHPGQDGAAEFHGHGWVYPGCVAHSPQTLSRLFLQAGFTDFRALPWFHPRQTWYALAKRADRLPVLAQDRFLGGAVLNCPPWQLSMQRSLFD